MEIRRHHWLVAVSAAALVHLAVVAGVRHEPRPSQPAPVIIRLGAPGAQEAAAGGGEPTQSVGPAGAPIVAAPLAATPALSEQVAAKVVEPPRTEVAPPKPKPKPKPQPKAIAKPKPRAQAAKPSRPTAVASTRTQTSAGPQANNSNSIAGRRPEGAGQAGGVSGGGSGKGGNRHGQGSGAGTLGMANYHGTLVAWLNRHKRYPSRARRLRQEGTVRVSFTIDRNGRILSHRIVTSSGHALLDQEVQAMLKRASPVPVLPSGIRESRLTITVPIRFSLR